VNLRVLAPGKVVLLGEYAVLDGAPALVAAVDRGVRCDVSSSPSDQRIVEAPGDTRFVAAALEAVQAPPARYTFSDASPVALPGGAKPGLGGSAAATVAAVLAGHLAAGREVPAADRLEQALAVHRAVQGSGSGVDVAASTLGGVVRYRAGGATAGCPVGASLSVVYSGAPSATGPRVERYLAWPDRARFVAASDDAVQRWADDPVGALRQAGQALRAMAEAAAIPYWTPAIGAIVALAEAHGGAGKPSGAGGGDVVVALFHGDSAREAFEAEAAGAGHAVIRVSIAPGAGPAV
jgi:phosphomevalonate kinase